jgi:hypothetical protein
LANNLSSIEEGAARRGGPRPEKHIHELVAVVIVVIPIAIGMPAVAILVPPTMAFSPAAFARFVQFVPRVIRLPAIPAVMFHGFVQPVVRPGDAALTTVVAFSRCPWRSGERYHPQKCRSGEYGLSEKPLLSPVKRHIPSILPKCPRLGWGVLFHRTQLRGECSKCSAIP